MHFFNGKELIKKITSGFLACSILLSSFMTTSAVASTTVDEEVIGQTGITIEIDNEGNVISMTNTASGTTVKSEPQSTDKDVSSNSSALEKDDKQDVGESNSGDKDSASNTDSNSLSTRFNKYYSLIDDNMVQTSSLFIQSSKTDLFTDVNISANIDDVYIIDFASLEEARYAYSYYVDKVDYISDLSNAIVLASNTATGGASSNATINNPNIEDYSGYIALIDTGAYGADASLSIFDNSDDFNGHGTNMLKIIKEINPDAKVLSIKAFEGRTTSAANLYMAIKLAIQSNVSVINLSLAGYDIESNKIVIKVIQEAIDKGITVIGAAGNYNASALDYIPGCIDDVITVGAINSDKTKVESSNYDADVYVIANSTSEAAALYTGLYTAGRLDEAIIVTNPDEDDSNEFDYSNEGLHGKGPVANTHDDKKAA